MDYWRGITSKNDLNQINNGSTNWCIKSVECGGRGHAGSAICMKIGRALYHILEKPNISIAYPSIPCGTMPHIWYDLIQQ